MKIAAITLAAVALLGCGKTINFSGETAVPFTYKAEKVKRVEVKKDRIVIREKIQFDVDRATIRPESSSLLDEIAAIIKKQPDIRRLQVEGHASSEGDPTRNLTLSDERAKSVVDALVERGIAREILFPIGFGSARPIADNDTQAGREANRRVEFIILERAKSEEEES